MPSLDLPTLIDLETQLLRDAEEPAEALDERDAPIAEGIDAARLDGVPLYLAWWGELRKRAYGDQPTPGERFARWHEAVRMALVLAGLLIGFIGMWGYLAAVTASGWPVNVIHFVAVFLGVQWLLLLLWLVLVLPVRVPGLGGLYALLGAVQALLPRIMHRLGGETGQSAQRIGRLYGRLRLWWVSRITQGFSLALNVGLVLGFLAAGAFNDPSFGWRSTLLTEAQLHRAVQVVATPWARLAPSAVVDRQAIAATRYSSLDAERFRSADATDDTGDRRAWSAWWAFLFAAMAVYGVLPRLVTWVVSGAGMRRRLGCVGLDHGGFMELRDRLKRPGRMRRAQAAAAGAQDAPLGAVDRVVVLHWSGAPGDEETFNALSRRRLGATVVGVQRVGALEVQADDAALAQAAAADADLAVIVPGWEPPVGEHLDLLRKLRRAVGERRQIIVLVAGHDLGEPTPDALALWRDALHTLNDPRLRTIAPGRQEDQP